MKRRQPHGTAGFALVITITLLALLVLAVYGLSLLTRVSGEFTAASAQQARARQHALMGLSLALADLQKQTGEDSRVTAMAGVTGVPANAASATRNWCGVWRTDGSFVAWLVSGANRGVDASLAAGVSAVVLVGAGSVGASSAHSEHVAAGQIPIAAGGVVLGHCAYLVMDEGAKLSAFAPPERLALAGVTPQLASTSSGTAQGRLRTALATHAARLPAVATYAQLSFLPTPGAPLTQSTLQDNFHHVTLTALSVTSGGLRSGVINLNTASPHVWRSVLETYNAVPGVTRIAASSIASRGAAIADGIANTGNGKAVRGPFTSVDAFGGSDLLADNLPDEVTPAEFMAAVGGMLTVRSDTFRVRARGDAVGPLDPAREEAQAWCEAIVQRTAGAGRAFIVVHFRWFGPDDL